MSVPEHDTQARELRMLQQATRIHWWRWQAEQKRLRQRFSMDEWGLHFEEMRSFGRLWRQTRAAAGFGRKMSPAVRRAYEQVLERRAMRMLREGD